MWHPILKRTIRATPEPIFWPQILRVVLLLCHNIEIALPKIMERGCALEENGAHTDTQEEAVSHAATQVGYKPEICSSKFT